MESSVSDQEIVSFQRRNELAGIEICTVHNSTQSFRSYCTGFEFLMPEVWQGEVWHRRQEAKLGPGSILCAQPGEVFLGRAAIVPGTRRSLTIDASVLSNYLAEQEVSTHALRFRSFAQLSKRLERRLLDIYGLLRPGPEPLEIQTGMIELVAAMTEELLEKSTGPTRELDSERRAAEQVRECLHHDLSGTMDLTTVAKQTGMTRFRALRVFKSWYGIPPHSYQLSVRLGLAQKSLRQGLAPAAVAVEYGFVDQSHLTKHFRRFFGVTPAKYAGIGA